MRYLLQLAIFLCVIAAVSLALAESNPAPVDNDMVMDASMEAPGAQPSAAAAAPSAGAPGAPAAVVGESSVEPTEVEVPDPGTAVSGLIAALKNAHWLAALGFALILLVWLFRLLGSQVSGWFDTRLGGWVLLFGTSFVGVIATGLIAGASFSWELLVSALTAALLATGMRKAFRDPMRPPKPKPA
jgi:hypothetical protein